jgi:hypothetical protein
MSPVDRPIFPATIEPQSPGFKSPTVGFKFSLKGRSKEPEASPIQKRHLIREASNAGSRLESSSKFLWRKKDSEPVLLFSGIVRAKKQSFESTLVLLSPRILQCRLKAVSSGESFSATIKVDPNTSVDHTEAFYAQLASWIAEHVEAL